MENKILEQLIIKGCCIDPYYLASLSSVFSKEYFDNPVAGKVYNFISEHFNEYKNIPQKAIIISEFDTSTSTEVSDFLNDVDNMEFNYTKNYDYLYNKTNDYLKEKAIKKAILSSVDIINKKEDIVNIRRFVEDALSKDLKIDLGINYFNSLNERLPRLMGPGDIRVPTGFPTFDERINGGFPPYTLSIMVAKIHGFKSTFLANMCARQVLLGKNVVLTSLEMSEDAFSQRFDSIFTLLDINKMYREKKLKIELMKKLKEIKELPGRGNLWIKQFPTGKATVEDFRKYLRELKIRGVNVDIFVCDYLNLMKPQYKSKGEMYGDVKSIAEDLRALSFEFRIPVVSVSQLNREGMMVSFDEVDFTYISESVGVVATADLVAIFGSSEDNAVYQSELFWKMVKNRLGGRVGEVDRFYFDQRNLKMYDSSEQEIWMNDAQISNDSRNMVEVKSDPVERNRGRKSRRR